MKKIAAAILSAVMILPLIPAAVLAGEPVVSSSVYGYISCESGDIEIASKNKTPKVYVDDEDWAGVVRAVGDLQSDIRAVTDVTPDITNELLVQQEQTGVVTGDVPQLITGENIENGQGILAVYQADGKLLSVQMSEDYADGRFMFRQKLEPAAGERVKGMVWSKDGSMRPLTRAYGKAGAGIDLSTVDIVVGTVGKSEAVDALADSGRLDVSQIKNKWEAFTVQNIDGTLVIAGADKRGTIFGVYDLSEKMGVSPWEWWADVTPTHSDAIYASLPAEGYTEGEPSVKYRGIFLNQEYNLNRWSLSMNPEGGYMNTQTYEKVFQLLLRLKANYMWPAMHEYSPAFNLNPENAKKADEYGIVMGTSHCEMLLRNNMGEFLQFQEKWVAAHPDKTLYMYKDSSLNADVAYDYTSVDKEGNPVDNKAFMEDYWRERIRENGSYENNYTIGMRGVHDGTWNPVSAKTDAEKTALLEEIITKQRQILSEETGRPAEEIPQTFIPYKEIATLYDKGIDIPEDVTVIRTNDNYGHIRQCFNEEEQARSGGGGIYYHVSYYGRPSSVIWNGGTQLGLIKEEMTKAYDSGADTVWVLNVGPLKPFENQMEYFLDLGRDIDTVRNTKINDYVAENAKHYFGFNGEQAKEYADIQSNFLQMANARRPEFQVQNIYSLTSYGDEGQKEVDRYADLLRRSTALYDALPEAKKPAFYELQLYAVKSANNIINNFIGADKSVLYKQQGRGANVNKYAKRSQEGYDAVKADTNVYNQMLNGKWDKIINPFQTKLHMSSDIKIGGAVAQNVSQLSYTEMGIAVEDQQDINTALVFSGYTKDVRFIDIFNQGTGCFDWAVSSDADWIVFNKQSGTVYDDDRIYVGIDWGKAPAGVNTAEITVAQYVGGHAVREEKIAVTLNNNVIDLPEKTYAEANGAVSMEAEHYTNSVTNGEYGWVEQDDLGRSGSSMRFEPTVADSISDNSAYLEYDVNFESSGTFDIDVYRMPTLNEGGSVKFAIGIDDKAPAVLAGTNKYSGQAADKWALGVLNNNETLTATITVDQPGIHKIKLYGVDPGAVVDKIVITTGTKYDSFYGAPESYNTTYNNEPAVMPGASQASTEITGIITPLFAPMLYTAGVIKEGNSIKSADVIKLTDTAEAAQITVAAYDNEGIMLGSKTLASDFSQAQVNDKITVPVGFTPPVGAAQIQVIVYDNKSSLNALSPVFTAQIDSLSPVASYDNGVIQLKSSLESSGGKEAVCRITPENSDEVTYIRQETVGDDTFRQIKVRDLDGTYEINIGVAGEGNVISEKVYTASNIEHDTEEMAEVLHTWDFSDASQVAAAGKNIPVVDGNAAYDSGNGVIKMTSDDKPGGKLNVLFDEPVQPVQGQTVTVVSKIAYGRQSGKYMDYVIADSQGNELIKSHISIYSSAGSLSIGGAEQEIEGMPAGIKTSKKENDGIKNGFSTYTAVLDPDTNTITLTVSNEEGSSTFTGKFPVGSSRDVGALNFSTAQTYASRSCYVDDISITKTTAPGYTMDFDVQNESGTKIEDAKITVLDAQYHVEMQQQEDRTYKLCDGLYSYTITADGYEAAAGELELSPATPSKTIFVQMKAI